MDSAIQKVAFLFFRRMRAPLLVLIATYSISVAGLVLMPGVDDQGNPWRFDFFHAFYFVSFMGSTIGFGEIPYAFSGAQRLWVAICIFFTVIAWLYAIGRIFSLTQDPAFGRAVTEARFIIEVRAIQTPFYIICGYGETGSLLVRALARRNIQCVVIDQNKDNISNLALENLGMDIPNMVANAAETHHLIEAGLRKSLCRGVVAITDNNDVNVKIAVTSKLLKPELQVICRASTQEAADNMASFNTDHIINPFEVFGEHLAMTQRTPSVHLLHAWLISLPGRQLDAPITPPKGEWVVCGYGRFGQASAKYLEAEGNKITVIENRPEKAPEGSIIGRGTEPGPLIDAGIRDAVGIVSGTNSDTNTLSAIMTARELNPDLYLVARQDRRADTEIFNAAKIDLVMEPSRIIVWRILPLITTPMLTRFLRLLREGEEKLASKVLVQVRSLTDGITPETWSIEISPGEAEAVYAAIEDNKTITLRHLISHPQDRDRQLRVIPLLHVQAENNTLLPDLDTPLSRGDRILFTGRRGCRKRMEWNLRHPAQLEYVVSGIESPEGSVWRWWTKRQLKKATANTRT